MRDFFAEIRYAARTLWSSPTFTILAIMTLALGIGANTATFSVIKEVLVRPLPYHEPDRLVVVGGDSRSMGVQDLTASSPELRDFSERSTTLEAIAASWMISVNLTSETVPERIGLCAVTTNYFNVLGRAPAMGRTFHPDDAGGNVSYVVVISHDAWKRIFNGDPEVIGKTVRLDDDPITIIGVMPERFEHPGESGTDRISAWIAVDLIPEGRFDNRGFKPFTLIGRLAPGSSIEASRAEFTSIAADYKASTRGSTLRARVGPFWWSLFSSRRSGRYGRPWSFYSLPSGWCF